MALKLAELYAEFRAKGLTMMLGKMKGLHVALQKANVGLTTLSRYAKRAFLVTGGLMAFAAREAIKFEKELGMVSTMLGEASMRWLPAYSRGLRQLSREFGESTTTLAKGLYDILSASVAPEQALQVLRTAAAAAAAGFTTTAKSADVITTVLNSYGMSADKAKEVSDKLFATVKRGKITFDELAGSLGMAAATAAVAGLSLDELLASIATMTRAGLNAHQAMTSVVGIIKTFLGPTSEAKKVAKELGIELNTAALRGPGLINVMKKLKDATAEQLRVLIPNIRGFRGFAAAMKDLEGVAFDLDMVMDSMGMTEEALAKRKKTLSFQLGQLKQGFLDVFRVMGEKLKPEIKAAVKWLGKLRLAIMNNAGGILKAIKVIALWSIKIIAVVTVLKILAVTIKALIGLVALFQMSLGAGVFGALIIALGVIILLFVDWEKQIDRIREKLNDLIDKQIKPQQIQERFVVEQIEKKKGRHAEERTGLERLGELRRKTSLTNEEQIEAANLARELKKEYPLLAGAIDELIGKEAQLLKIREAMVASQEKSLRSSRQALRGTTGELVKDTEEEIAEIEKALKPVQERVRKRWEEHSETATDVETKLIEHAKKEIAKLKKTATAYEKIREQLRRDLSTGKHVGITGWLDWYKEMERKAQKEQDRNDAAAKQKLTKAKEFEKKHRNLVFETKKLEIEATKTGEEKIRALQALRWEKTLKNAKDGGLDEAEVRKNLMAKEAAELMSHYLSIDQKRERALTSVLGGVRGSLGKEGREMVRKFEREQLEGELGPEQAAKNKGLLDAMFKEKDTGAGKWMGIADVWKQLQSAAVNPELELSKKQLEQLEQLLITLKELRKDLRGEGARAG